jgi:hypothetical protein
LKNFKIQIMRNNYFHSNIALVGCLLIGLLLFAGCANKEIVTSCLHGHTFGFWGGLWHGFIAPFDLLGMLIWNDVTVYAQNTNGAWYAFGFLLGSGGWGFFGGRGVSRRRH